MDICCTIYKIWQEFIDMPYCNCGRLLFSENIIACYSLLYPEQLKTYSRDTYFVENSKFVNRQKSHPNQIPYCDFFFGSDLEYFRTKSRVPPYCLSYLSFLKQYSSMQNVLPDAARVKGYGKHMSAPEIGSRLGCI